MSDKNGPVYDPPELTEFGTVEDITRGRAGGQDGDVFNDGGEPPGQGGDHPGNGRGPPWSS
jgi:hypothetical protein